MSFLIIAMGITASFGSKFGLARFLCIRGRKGNKLLWQLSMLICMLLSWLGLLIWELLAAGANTRTAGGRLNHYGWTGILLYVCAIICKSYIEYIITQGQQANSQTVTYPSIPLFLSLMVESASSIPAPCSSQIRSSVRSQVKGLLTAAVISLGNLAGAVAPHVWKHGVLPAHDVVLGSPYYLWRGLALGHGIMTGCALAVMVTVLITAWCKRRYINIVIKASS